MPYKISLRSTGNTVQGKIANIKAAIIDSTLSISGAAADAKVVGDELQLLASVFEDHATADGNPHNVTKTDVGLGNVDNTSDADKPVSTAQATAIAEAKQAGDSAMAEAKKKVAKTNVVVNLSKSAWSSNKQTVSVAGVTSDNTIIAGAAPESYISYAESNVRCSAQGNGTLTFQCDDVPSVDLTANIMILD